MDIKTKKIRVHFKQKEIKLFKHDKEFAKSVRNYYASHQKNGY